MLNLPDYNPQQDKELRSRVKLFGNLLGNVIRRHEHSGVFAAVEKLRKGYLGLRKKDDARKRAQLVQHIAKLDSGTLEQVIRAFSIYFNLVNIAEEAFQHRQRRRLVHATGQCLWNGSFLETLRGFKADGIDESQLQTLLDNLIYMPVFTAHPTEAKRRTIMGAQRRVFEISQELNDKRLGKVGRDEITAELELHIEILWRTNEVRNNRPQVTDEIRNGLHYFNRSLFAAVPDTYRFLEKAVSKVYGTDANGEPIVNVSSFLRFGSWIGGDRDGNPNVKPETTAMALRMQAREILHEYLRQVEALSKLLTHSSAWCTPSDEFIASLAKDDAMGLAEENTNHSRFTEEVYRRKLYFMAFRLRENLRHVRDLMDGGNSSKPAAAYASELDFLNDLTLIRDSLISHGDRSATQGPLNDLIRLVETFGFHLCELDIRQESTRHSSAVAEIAAADHAVNYASLSETERLTWLATQIKSSTQLNTDKSNFTTDTQETLEVLEVMYSLRKEIGPRSFSAYVISMTHTASHIMEVMFLASLSGLAGKNEKGWFCDLRISPLFETIEDLNHIESVLTLLLDNQVYTDLLDASGNLQEVMLGYSDSCKDGGFVSAAWGLYQAQKKVIKLTNNKRLKCRLFHGRGGTIGRGGGPTHEAILSQPAGTVQGQIKFTEQGEVLSTKYSNRETAGYELTMGSSGLMKASACMVVECKEEHSDYYPIMDELCKLGERQYRDLTDDTKGFLEYFYDVGPVNEIGMMNIGSRPSHRKSGDLSKSSIRAIAWVFSWAQARHTLPAWYGIGYALSQWIQSKPDGLDTLREMFQKWPFFHSMISNSQMALSKADMSTAKEYSELCSDPAAAKIIFEKIDNEFNATVSSVKDIASIDTLLAMDPPLALSRMRRDPYLDPLHHIQIMLLKRYRDESLTDEERDSWLSPLLRSINAIAAGMRNTG